MLKPQLNLQYMEVTIKLTFLFKEFEKLKDEQQKRIEFRDHMIYLTLAAIGTVFSFSIEKADFNSALLVLPFIILVLGWTYLTNDLKITTIGKYIQCILIPKLEDADKNDKLTLGNTWEDFFKKDVSRKSRKRIQLCVDLLIFCVSGLLSILAFFVLHQHRSFYHYIVAGCEILVIGYLIWLFFKHFDK